MPVVQEPGCRQSARGEPSSFAAPRRATGAQGSGVSRGSSRNPSTRTPNRHRRSWHYRQYRNLGSGASSRRTLQQRTKRTKATASEGPARPGPAISGIRARCNGRGLRPTGVSNGRFAARYEAQDSARRGTGTTGRTDQRQIPVVPASRVQAPKAISRSKCSTNRTRGRPQVPAVPAARLPVPVGAQAD